jgi:hypothetical protein
METLLFISLFIYIACKIAVIKLFGTPGSFSETFYLLNERKKDLGYLFTLWCYAVGISVMIVMMNYSEGKWYQFLPFFAGGALCFTGTAPLFKGREKTIHFVSASVCAAIALLWMYLEGYWLIPFEALAIYLLLMEISGKRCLTFYLESVVFESCYTVLMLKLFF